MDFLDIRGFIGFIIVVFVVGTGYFFMGWLNNEPQILIKDSNLYEYNEFLTSSEAESLDLEGGMGNYFKYSGNYEIEVDYVKVEKIVQYKITVDLNVIESDNINIYTKVINNPSSLTLVEDVSQSVFFDDDYEEGILRIEITYINRRGAELTYSEQIIINVDEDWF